MQLQFTVQDGQVWVGGRDESVEVTPVALKPVSLRGRGCPDRPKKHAASRRHPRVLVRPPPVARPEWFREDPAFDREIAERFGALIERRWPAARRLGGHAARRAGAHPRARPVHAQCLSRHAARLRGRRAGAGGGAPMVGEGDDEALPPRAAPVRLPAVRARRGPRGAARGAAALRRGVPISTTRLQWARKHHDVIERFGRFPHRNAILGRASTPEEIEFLKQPGSRF